MRIADDHPAFDTEAGEQDPLRGSPLMRGDDLTESGNFPDTVSEAIPRSRSRVGLVAAHHRGPLLLGGHGAGSGIRQQIDEDLFGRDAEQIPMRTAQDLLALLARRHAQWLNDLDAKGLDNAIHFCL